MGSRGRGYRTFNLGGFEVLVGRGDADNDALTFRVGEPRDFWLHVAGAPGSHVVVRNPDDLPELPREVLEPAAALAAWHSKARGRRGKVEVHVCRVADVSKARGAPAGEVRLRRWDAVRVYPAAGAAGEGGE
jgi:predicted ribosome quality control (RQC) complex YloA/Tae2 family protein